ncbi:MAG TPA: amino acid ABC transporter ATP-binding protein [Pirellulaceae bacterium]
MISIEHLHKQFGATDVLRGVSFRVDRGEVAVILGPSGGGKSTLLRTINGLEPFDRGTIQVDGIRLGPEGSSGRDHALREIRRRVGMVFQQFQLFAHRSVLDNVIEAPLHVLKRSRRQAVAEAEELLERVGLGDKLQAMPATLSGGQQQRVAIARALAMQPEAILFDEPTSSLDPEMTVEVTRVIADLAESGQTMLVVTHDLEFARRIAHTIHLMHAGQVLESGPPSAILDSPQDEVTRRFVSQGVPWEPTP